MRYFLEQCLYSVFRSKTSFDFEVFVVDNASSDDSLRMLEQKFPQVQLIANTENTGFSKANNQAMQLSKGEYILLLNPDTLIQEDTLQKCIARMDGDKNIGGLGIKMYDGGGNFLPESKRGFPSPMAALSKMTGLSKLFPTSKIFGQYHLTYLDKNSNQEVDVLSGAFMLLRKSVLDIVGLLDEDYFMYGEDIDLSYRIKKAGFKNLYLAETSIIHFKGESTKKGSLNYLRTFYQAMIIFARKHVAGSKGKMLTLLLQIAIYLRAVIAVMHSLFSGLFFPIVDALLMTAGCFLSVQLFEQYVLSEQHVQYPSTFFSINIPIYIALWLVGLWFWGVYFVKNKWKNLLVGMLTGTLLIAVVYSFFPLSLRSSRGIIVSAFLFNLLFLSAYRFLIAIAKGKLNTYIYALKKYIIISEGEEAYLLKSQIEKSYPNRSYLGFVSLSNDIQFKDYLGNIDSISEINEAYTPDELLFSTDTIPMQKIIEAMAKLKEKPDFKLVSKNNAIIGSSSKNTSGDVYTFDVDIKSNKPFLQRVREWL